MILFIKLLLAHCLGDFLLQPDSWVKEKMEKKWKAPQLYYHIAVHVLMSLILVFAPKYFLGVLVIGVSHYVIDLGKIYNQNERNHILLFGVDQILHVLVLLLVANYYTPFVHEHINSDNLNQIVLLVFSILLITSVSSSLVKVLISKWAPETEDKDEDSLSNAGGYIGVLERLFVFGFVITGNIQAVGFLLAAKSVFRFGDLKDSKDRKLTEYILIGTLISFGIAILVGFLYLKVKEKTL